MTQIASQLISGLRVLVVEDQALIAEEIGDRLSRMGARAVTVTHSGAGAIETAGRESPDLVLMDIRLKGDIDGIEAAKAIRVNSDIPIVYVTAHSDHATLTRVKETAPHGYVLKPFSEQELMMAVEMAVAKHGLERRQRESEGLLQATLDSMGYAIITTDLNSSVTFMNPVAEWLTKWKNSEAMGRSIEEVLSLVAGDGVAISDRHPMIDALGNQSASLRQYSFVLFNKMRLSIPIEGTASAICDSDRQVLGAVTVFRNVPERRLVEDLMRPVQDDFQKLEEMDGLQRLAGGVAHEFNNTLAVVSGYAQLLKSQVLPELQPKLDAILKASNRGAAVVRKLLLYSQRKAFEMEPVDVHAAILRLREDIADMAGANIHVNFLLSPLVGEIKGEKVLLEQLLLNVCSNACEAMPDGGTLTITTAERETGAGHLRSKQPDRLREIAITVSDTGHGIDSIIQRRVFQPFFTTKPLADGAGLGMAVAHGIVSAFGGMISCRPNPEGQGTRVKITFPTIDEGQAMPESMSLDYRLIGRESVLLLGPNQAPAGEIAQSLLAYGYDVLNASSIEACDVNAEAHRTIRVIVVSPGEGEGVNSDVLNALRSQHPLAKWLFVARGPAIPAEGFKSDTAVVSLPEGTPVLKLLKVLRELMEA